MCSVLGLILGLLAASLGAEPAAPPFECRLREASGLPEADAAIAARVVCAEIESRSGGRGAFHVSLTRLGAAVMVETTREGDRLSVTARADGLEEVPRLAGRLAEALVQGRPFADTQRVDNLLADEAREALTKKGTGVKRSVGVLGLKSFGHGAGASGFSLGVAYTTPRFALPAELRFGWSGRPYDEPGLSLLSLSTGARGYLTNRDVSPFAGAGFCMLKLSAREGDYGNPRYFHAERLGVAPYLETGIEGLRLHRARLALSLRADLPLNELRSERHEVWDWDPRRGAQLLRVVPAESRYVVPVSAQLTLTF
jgi:hypothetical protein